MGENRRPLTLSSQISSAASPSAALKRCNADRDFEPQTASSAGPFKKPSSISQFLVLRTSFGLSPIWPPSSIVVIFKVLLPEAATWSRTLGGFERKSATQHPARCQTRSQPKPFDFVSDARPCRSDEPSGIQSTTRDLSRQNMSDAGGLRASGHAWRTQNTRKFQILT